MNQTVWKYESGDKKSIFGRPYTYNGTKWIPDEGGKKEEISSSTKSNEGDAEKGRTVYADLYNKKKKIDSLSRSDMNNLLTAYGIGPGVSEHYRNWLESPKVSKKDKDEFIRTLSDAIDKDKEKKSKEEAKYGTPQERKDYADYSKKAFENVTPSQKKALKKYVYGEGDNDELFDDLNSSLRKGDKNNPHAKVLTEIDNAFKNTKPYDMKYETLYRGFSLSKDKFKDLKPGGTFKDDAFVSTSPKQVVAQDFIDMVKGRDDKDAEVPILMKIAPKKGSKIIPLGVFSGEYARHQELLINRGSSFKISGLKRQVITILWKYRCYENKN